MPRLQLCNIVGRTDVSEYAFDPILSRDKNLRMGSKAYPEMSYLPYNITPRHNPKELQHKFRRRENLRITYKRRYSHELRLFLLNLTSLHVASVPDI